MRAVAVVAAWLLLLGARLAAADTVDSATRQLGDTSYKVRLAAALSLSKSRDPRAVIALAGALRDDENATIRRVAALALEKMVDARTAIDARELALGALESAATKDIDTKVRETSARVLKVLSDLRTKRKPVARGDRPEVFVAVDGTTDQSKQLPSGAGDRLTRIVKQRIEGKGYATTWPNGGQPTSAELSSSRSRAFIVVPAVKKIDVMKQGTQTQIACTLVVRVAPWNGKDGGERWEANRSASASGSAKATTGSRDRDIENGKRDCLEAVADDVTSRQVVPFIAHLAASGS
jgi:hypothetical protein